MTDIDMSTGTASEYLVAMIVFWTVFVVGFLVFALYVWPAMEHAYKRVANIVHYYIRGYHTRSGYDGYTMHEHYKEGMKR